MHVSINSKMLAINFIVCAWCVLLTLVSAADLPEENISDSRDRDEENYAHVLYLYGSAWRELQKDFEQISDTLDFEMDHLVDLTELSAHLNTAPEFKERRFIKFINFLKSKTSCDRNMRSDLIKLRKMLRSIVRPITSPFIRLVVDNYLIEGLRLCARDLETDKDVMEFIASPWLQDFIGIREEVEAYMQKHCGNKHCYKRMLSLRFSVGIVYIINKHRLRDSNRVNGIKLSFEFFKIMSMFEKYESSKISGFLSILMELRDLMGSSWGPNADMILYQMSLCWQLKGREHLHILKLQEYMEEYRHEPVCWKFFHLFGGYVYNREPCPGIVKPIKDQTFI